MANWFSKETKSLYIERPAAFADELIYLHPDKSIARGAKLTVRSDECALFFRDGRFVGELEAGSHVLDTANLPFFGHLVVDSLTGGNHFITELFFVKRSEVTYALPWTALGQYIDLNSRHVVSVLGKASFTVKVNGARQLISGLGGQSANASTNVVTTIVGRLLNGMRKIVGQRVQQQPVLTVVSNAEAEAFGQELLTFAQVTLADIGVGLQRILEVEMSLDDKSLSLLRDFGMQESALEMQMKGSRVAAGPGFAEFNLVQGQRAALEGLGKGLATGHGSMILGAGFDLSRPPHASAFARPSVGGTSGARTSLAPPRAYFVVSSDNEEGPFSPRQIALLAVTSKRPLKELQIRGDDDPVGSCFSADAEPAILQEYRKRVPAQPSSGRAASRADAHTFDIAFKAISAGGSLTSEQVSMLGEIAVNVGLAPDPSAARLYVIGKAAESGVTLS